MGHTDEWENVKRCAVRIATEEGKKLKGSGILFIRNKKDNALIFTAAHVIDDIWGQKKDVEVKLCLSLEDADDNCHSMEIQVLPATEISGEIDKYGLVYQHWNYNRETLENDAAIICVPWEDWMDGLHNFPLDKPRYGIEQRGFGFPASMNNEWKKDGKNELAGKLSFQGTVEINVSSRYSVSYRKGAFEMDVSREDVMRGFSGSGLFEKKNGIVVLNGIISMPGGDEGAGEVLWASDSNLFLEIMNRYGLEPEIPKSFQPFKSTVMKTFADHRKDARDFFSDIVDDLILNKGLLPKDMVEDSNNALKCKDGWKCCWDYWEGQLKKVVMLCGINGIPKDQTIHPVITMPEPFENDDVQAEFLCTETTVEEVICDLVEKDYFSTDGYLKDKTLFLWNGKKGNLYEKELFSRGDFRGIMVNIARGKREFYTSREFYGKVRELLPEEEKNAKFDIIEGKLSECNLALVGIGRLMEPLEQGKGEEEKMKKKMGELLKQIWEA